MYRNELLPITNLPITELNSLSKEICNVSENQINTYLCLTEAKITMILDKQLKILLQRNDVTIAQLARATKISAKTLYQWLQKQKPRDLNQVRKVADYFEVSIDFLAFGIELKSKSEIKDYQEEINAGVFEIILRKPKS